MYSSLSAAFVRPGVGTLTDLISFHVFAFCFYEDRNDEMLYNAKLIESNSLGKNCLSAEQALDEYLQGLSHSSSLITNHESFELISLAGKEDFAGFLQEFS